MSRTAERLAVAAVALARVRGLTGKFDEGKHPRGRGGKFASKAGGGGGGGGPTLVPADAKTAPAGAAGGGGAGAAGRQAVADELRTRTAAMPPAKAAVAKELASRLEAKAGAKAGINKVGRAALAKARQLAKEQAKAKGGSGTFDPAKHPRGSDGRFISHAKAAALAAAGKPFIAPASESTAAKPAATPKTPSAPAASAAPDKAAGAEAERAAKAKEAHSVKPPDVAPAATPAETARKAIEAVAASGDFHVGLRDKTPYRDYVPVYAVRAALNKAHPGLTRQQQDAAIATAVRETGRRAISLSQRGDATAEQIAAAYGDAGRTGAKGKFFIDRERGTRR